MLSHNLIGSYVSSMLALEFLSLEVINYAKHPIVLLVNYEAAFNMEVKGTRLIHI